MYQSIKALTSLDRSVSWPSARSPKSSHFVLGTRMRAMKVCPVAGHSANRNRSTGRSASRGYRHGWSHGESVATETLVSNACVWRHETLMCGYTNKPHQGNINPRQLAGVAGIDDNHTLTGSVAKMTLASFAPNCADDVTHAVLCGACDEARGEHYACYAVSYETTDIDGEPTGERLFCCKAGLGDTVEWANTYNRSFVPPAISRLTPYCPACGAAWHACTTDARGLCVKASVAS